MSVVPKENRESSSAAKILTICCTSLLVGGSLYYTLNLVSMYGWEGALNYVWEGDPYPNLRDYLRALDVAGKSIDDETRILDSLEEALERAKLDSVEGYMASSVLILWERNASQLNLHKQLARLSDALDKLAAKIDRIPGEEKANIRSRKKIFSRRMVKLMERTDRLIGFYDSARDAAE